MGKTAKNLSRQDQAAIVLEVLDTLDDEGEEIAFVTMLQSLVLLQAVR